MTETIKLTLPVQRWQGDRGTYHLVIIPGQAAEQIAIHARLHRMEFGKQRGFGSVKIIAQINETRWKTSVFPQNSSTEWVLLISKKVMRAQDLELGQAAPIVLELL